MAAPAGRVQAAGSALQLLKRPPKTRRAGPVSVTTAVSTHQKLERSTGQFYLDGHLGLGQAQGHVAAAAVAPAPVPQASVRPTPRSHTESSMRCGAAHGGDLRIAATRNARAQAGPQVVEFVRTHLRGKHDCVRLPIETRRNVAVSSSIGGAERVHDVALILRSSETGGDERARRPSSPQLTGPRTSVGLHDEIALVIARADGQCGAAQAVAAHFRARAVGVEHGHAGATFRAGADQRGRHPRRYRK